MKTKIVDFTLGADPEFCCLGRCDGYSEDQVIHGYDHNISNCNDFGTDGNESTFEVRPDPSKDPIEIVNNIHDILLRKTFNWRQLLLFKWKAGSYIENYPMGGHIHFGIHSRRIRHIVATEYLDNYLGPISLLIEDREEGKNRRVDGYGCKGDFRKQLHGFEYRVPSSWITSPYVASAILCLAKTIMFEVLNNPKFGWQSFGFTSGDFQFMNTDKILAKFPEMWKDIIRMKLYQVYKPYIDLLYFLVKNNKSWYPSCSMKEAWGIVDVPLLSQEYVDLNVVWHRFINGER